MEEFLGDVIPTGLSPRERGELINILRKLAFFDSIHDFWPERKTTGVQKSEDDDDELIDIPADRLELVHTRLTQTIAGYTSGTGDIGTILSNQTGGFVTSVSDIENRVMKYIAKNYTPYNTKETSIAFADIFTNWKFNDNWPEYSQRIGQLSDVLEVVGNGRSVKSLTDEERGILAFFVLAYMNPGQQPGTQGSDVEMTFDMAPRDIGKIFARINQVRNAIYPQNVADSATTSFSALQGRSVFRKANGALGGDAVGPEHIVRSNLFSYTDSIIKFVDRGFGPKDKFGFSIVVANRNGKETGRIDFGPGSEQGPSVNYLMDIISQGRVEGIDPNVRTIARLSSGLNDLRILFDLKRMGDHEQMRVDAYGVTGDRLAAVYRRLLRKPGIYHSHVGFRIFRYLGNIISPEENAKRSETFQCNEVVEKLKLISNYGAQYAAVGSDLNRMKEHVGIGMVSGTVLMPPIDVRGADFNTQYTAISATFATAFLRYRMRDIYNHIERLQTRLAGLNPAQFAPIIPILEAVADGVVQEDLNVYNAEGINITRSRQDAETYLSTMAELNKMNVSFDTAGVSEPYFVELFQPNGRLKKGVKSSIFNFASGPYLHNESGMQVAIARLLTIRRSTRIDAIKKNVYENLGAYLSARDAAKEAFFDETMLTTIEAASDITNGLTLEQIVGKVDVAPGQQSITQAINNVVGLGLPPVVGGARELVKVGIDAQAQKIRRQDRLTSVLESSRSAAIQDRRIPPVLQYRDIHDLFVETCIDSVNGMPLDNVEVKWTLGISDIRIQSGDEYGRVFEESDATDLITFFLSWRNGAVESTPLFQLREGDDPVYGNRKLRGNLTIINYLSGAMLTAPDKEAVIRNVLGRFAEVFATKPAAFEAFGRDGTGGQWSGIPTQLQTFVAEVTRYRMGGGRRKKTYRRRNGRGRKTYRRRKVDDKKTRKH